MAVTDWWLGNNGTGYATVVCRCDSNDAVTVVCNGASFTGNPNTAVKDGVVSITVTGIGEERVAYTVDGVEGGTLRGLRSGDMTIASGSCWYASKPDTLAYQLLREYDLDVVFALGDFPYANASWTLYGETAVGTKLSIANAKDTTNYLAHHRMVRKIPGIKELKRSVPFYYMPDDHEYPMDNACNDLTFWQSVTGEPQPLATQTDLDDAWAAARTAISTYTTGNPQNTDVGIDSDAVYCRKRMSDNVEWFLIDCINYRTVYTAADDASKTMLGASQKAWLIDAVKASTATFKLIAMPKQLWKGGNNGDTFVPVLSNTGYLTERAELFWELRNVTGLFFIAGDQHRFTDQMVAADEMGAGYPAISCLVGAPATSEQNVSSVTGYDTGVVFRDNGPNTAPGGDGHENVYTVLEIKADRVNRLLLSSRKGVISRGYIEAGSNQVQYPSMRFG